MSEHARDSHNCRREINFAIELRKEPLVIYLEDVQMSLGMRMQLGSLQAIFYNRHSNRDSFLDELCRSRVLDVCRDRSLQVHTVDRSPEEAYHKGNEYSFKHAYKEAVKWYRQAAEQGHTEAQVKLGECYRRGWGVAKNRVEATIWYRNAAENGNTDAMMALGNCYHSEGNNIEAVKWYRHAAEQGDVVAQHQLGECYSYGVGVEKDDTEAAKWYRAAAEKGHSESQKALGDCLYYGEGVAEDVTEAVEWYRKAAEKGDCSAQYILETIGIVW